MATKARTIKPEHIQLLMAYISRNAGCVAVADAVRLYSQPIVDHLIKNHMVTPTTIVFNHPTNRMPPTRISAIYTSEWTRERPAWLDRYI